jgi:hypothetical protein
MCGNQTITAIFGNRQDLKAFMRKVKFMHAGMICEADVHVYFVGHCFLYQMHNNFSNAMDWEKLQASGLWWLF